MRLAIWKRRAARAVLVLAVLAAPGGAPVQPAGAQVREPAQQDEFVPLDEIPADEQLPAAPLVIAAYAVAWLIILIYLWSIWRRLGRVEREIASVRSRIGPGEPPRRGEGQ